MPERYDVPETSTRSDAVAGAAEPSPLVPLMRRGELGGPSGPADPALTAQVLAQIEESRRFLAQHRQARPAPADPDELQARIMHRSGRPGVEHYLRVFQVEGMALERAQVEARRMVEADHELLVRYPAA